MRRPAHVFALCAVAWLAVACQTSAERCNDHPDDPGCIPDAGTVGGLTWRTIQQEVGDGWADVELGLCGAFIREVVWLMPDGAPADGFVVQQIDIETTGVCPVPPESPLLDSCTEPPSAEHLPAHCVEDGAPFIDRGGIRFWEAFPMAAGDVRYARSDRWNFSPQAVPRGEMTVTGLARYYTAEEMGDEHPEHPDGPFRQAPAEVPNSRLAGTLVEPGFWGSDDRPALERRVRVGWRCCPPQVTVLEEDTHDR